MHNQPLSEKSADFSRFAVRVPALRFSARRLLLLAVDTALVNAAVVIALFGWCLVSHPADPSMHFRQRWYWFPVLTGTWLIAGWIFDLYVVASASRRLVTFRCA